MRHSIRALFSCATLLLCALAVGPPPGFSLCIDTDGHLVIEAGDPGRGRCCVPTAGGNADEACQPDDCATCLDYMIAAHDALRASEAAGTLPEWTPTLPALGHAAPAPSHALVIPAARAEAPRNPGASAPTPLRL